MIYVGGHRHKDNIHLKEPTHHHPSGPSSPQYGGSDKLVFTHRILNMLMEILLKFVDRRSIDQSVFVQVRWWPRAEHAVLYVLCVSCPLKKRLRARKPWKLLNFYIFQCKVKKFCVEVQRVPFQFQFKNSQIYEHIYVSKTPYWITRFYWFLPSAAIGPPRKNVTTNS